VQAIAQAKVPVTVQAKARDAVPAAQAALAVIQAAVKQGSPAADSLAVREDREVQAVAAVQAQAQASVFDMQQEKDSGKMVICKNYG
jgi:hypothetical protein